MTKILAFEHCKRASPAFSYAGNPIEQVEEFKYLGVLMDGTRGLSLDPAIESLCRAAGRPILGWIGVVNS